MNDERTGELQPADEHQQDGEGAEGQQEHLEEFAENVALQH